MSSLARLMEAIEFLAVLIISSALIETFLPLPIVLKRLCNNLSFRGSDKAGRGELLKKQKHGCSKDITYGLQFRENALENPLNLVFGRSDKMRDRFPFSGNIPEVSDVLRNGELLNRILVDEDEPGDSEGSLSYRF